MSVLISSADVGIALRQCSRFLDPQVLLWVQFLRLAAGSSLAPLLDRHGDGCAGSGDGFCMEWTWCLACQVLVV